jgi:hypothetical protein
LETFEKVRKDKDAQYLKMNTYAQYLKLAKEAKREKAKKF